MSILSMIIIFYNLYYVVDFYNFCISVPQEVVTDTVSAVTAGNFSVLNVNSILGDALSAITNELGIDMK